ncbi:MAG: aminotransferase class V-fold PLP-dependent enzyme [Candidatus Omnitrophica bacterium]|nr:aminotransferase class V-fold PLP-dependent enzyme [Candidatus Omnitrophota bacterium]
MNRKRFLLSFSVWLALAIVCGNAQYLYGVDPNHPGSALKSPPASSPENPSDRYDHSLSAFARLKRAVTLAIEHYSNVHRGEGQHSMASTALFERARSMVRAYLGLGDDYEIIFGSARGIDALVNSLKPGANYKVLYSDRETGLRFCVAALAVQKKFLPDTPPVVGGGQVDDVGDNSAAWSEAPEKFEPGTPNITGVIMFARALGMMQKSGDKNMFKERSAPGQAEKPQADLFPGLKGSQLLRKLRETLVGKDGLVPSEEGMVRYINLDNGASTPTFGPIMKSAFDAMQVTDEEARKIISDAKAGCLSYFHASNAEYECVFTSNTTESVNIAAEIAATFHEGGVQPVVIGTDLEHNSNELPWRNNTLLHVPVDNEGFIDLVALERFLKEYNKAGAHGNKKIYIVTVSGASNVLGTFNNISAISKLTHAYGAYLHIDAAQLAAHREVDMGAIGIDLLSCSGHKMYAPFGTGCLVARKGLLLRLGEDKLRQAMAYGERNVVGIASLAASMRILKDIGLDTLEKEERILTARVLRGFAGINKKYGSDTIFVFGIQDPDRLGDKGPVVCFYVEGIPHNIVAGRLAEMRGIGVRTGCFCAHRLLKFLFDSRDTDVAWLVREGKAPGLTRVSIGLENTPEDIDEFIRILTRIVTDPENKKFIPGALNCRYCAGKPVSTHEISKEIDAFVRDIVNRVYDDDMKI